MQINFLVCICEYAIFTLFYLNTLMLFDMSFKFWNVRIPVEIQR